jgi:hypothetical protein
VTVLRTAFLAYVRVLLCLQGIFLGLMALIWWPGQPDTPYWTPLDLSLLFPFLGLAGIGVALLLRRGRRWAVLAAILIEALWAVMAAASGYKILTDLPINWSLWWTVTAAAALFLLAVAGLLACDGFPGLAYHRPGRH